MSLEFAVSLRKVPSLGVVCLIVSFCIFVLNNRYMYLKAVDDGEHYPFCFGDQLQSSNDNF